MDAFEATDDDVITAAKMARVMNLFARYQKGMTRS